MYTCQCPRCDGTGKYDRGTCFTCKGVGYKNQATKPRALTLYTLSVTFENGSVNTPNLYATSRAKAVSIVERMCAIKEWKASVK